MLSWHDIAFGISDLSDVSEILPFFFWLWAGNRTEPYLIMAMYFLCSGTISIYGFMTAQNSVHNLHLYHIWAILQVVFVYMFFKALWKESVGFWAVLVWILLYISMSIWVQRIDTMNSLCWTSNNVIIIWLGNKHLYRLYHDDSITSLLQKRPDFFITAGWLVYSSGSLFAYLMGQEILKGEPQGFFHNAWIFQSVSNIIKTGACCYAFRLIKV